jgi:hypothetical protein
MRRVFDQLAKLRALGTREDDRSEMKASFWQDREAFSCDGAVWTPVLYAPGFELGLRENARCKNFDRYTDLAA